MSLQMIFNAFMTLPIGLPLLNKQNHNLITFMEEAQFAVEELKMFLEVES